MKVGLSATVALFILPLLAIPAYRAGLSLSSDPNDKAGLGVMLGLGVPTLLSMVITRRGGGASWVVAILLGLASGVIAAFVLFVGFLVGCAATNCGS